MFLILAAAAATACSLTPAEEATLRDLKTRRWPAIYATPDAVGLAAFLHPQFQMIDGAGAVSTKDEEVAYLRTKAPDPPERRFTYLIERLEVFPNCTAIISGRGRIEIRKPGAAATVDVYSSSNVLIKVDGRWRPIASHVSGETAEAK